MMTLFRALPLACLIAAAPATAQTIDWNKGRSIAVTVNNDRFIPARIVLRSGQHYILRFRNASGRKHNFSAQKFFDVARVAPADARLVSNDDVNLDPGARATVRIVAPDTPGALYEFRSTVLGDAAEKMKGEIVVQ
jgi:FtsP/CotA-like multicopper oxidase with cupredoxin domain